MGAQILAWETIKIRKVPPIITHPLQNTNVYIKLVAYQQQACRKQNADVFR